MFRAQQATRHEAGGTEYLGLGDHDDGSRLAAMTSTETKTGLDGVAAAVKQAPGRGLPPVHLWHPAHCGEIDIVIAQERPVVP